MFSRTFAFSSNVWREKKNNNKNSIFFVRAKSENKYNWKTWFSYCPNVFVAYKQTKKIHFIHSFVCDWLDKQKEHYIAAFPLDIRHDGNSFPARRTAFWLARTPCCACVKQCMGSSLPRVECQVEMGLQLRLTRARAFRFDRSKGVNTLTPPMRDNSFTYFAFKSCVVRGSIFRNILS